MRFVIHHPGKAGEVFLALPMARLLKEHYPDCSITWVVIDLYRDAVGHYPYIDEVATIPNNVCNSLGDVASLMFKHRTCFCKNQRFASDQSGIHIDAYYNYNLFRTEANRFILARAPFYTQFFRNAVYFCPSAHEVDSWRPPEWHPTEQAIRDGEEFEKRYGGGPMVIFSPFVADKSCLADNQSDFDMELIYGELRKWNLPLICTGTKWDTKQFPTWAIDGYAPELSLGGLFYLIQNRAALVVSPNSGIGFAGHWLGAPTLMIDNRTGWPEQVKVWKEKVPLLDDEALPHERRWPLFMKDNFYPQHLLPVPFEQIEWSPEGFLEALEKIKGSSKSLKESAKE